MLHQLHLGLADPSARTQFINQFALRNDEQVTLSGVGPEDPDSRLIVVSPPGGSSESVALAYAPGQDPLLDGTGDERENTYRLLGKLKQRIDKAIAGQWGTFGKFCDMILEKDDPVSYNWQLLEEEEIEAEIVWFRFLEEHLEWAGKMKADFEQREEIDRVRQEKAKAKAAAAAAKAAAVAESKAAAKAAAKSKAKGKAVPASASKASSPAASSPPTFLAPTGKASAPASSGPAAQPAVPAAPAARRKGKKRRGSKLEDLGAHGRRPSARAHRFWW